MALLTERQRTADALMRELHRLGAWVTNPLPLREDAQLMFQVLDTDRSQILQKLSEWGWGVTLAGNTPRITSRGMEAATLYQLDLPADRPAVVDDRQMIQSEFAERKKTSAEIEAVKRYLGMTK
jgi:hypothetical protein